MKTKATTKLPAETRASANSSNSSELEYSSIDVLLNIYTANLSNRSRDTFSHIECLLEKNMAEMYFTS